MGKSIRAARGTYWWPWLGAGRPEEAPPRSRGSGGGSWRRRRRSGELGRRRVGRGVPAAAKEASYGVIWVRGRVEEGFRGGLGGGGGHGGGDSRSRATGTTELGARAQEGRREGWGRLGARGIGLGGQEREKGRGAVVRVVTASPWRFGGHPRRACRG